LNTLTPSYQIPLQTTTKELATPGNWPLTSLVHSVPETSMMVQSSKQRTKAKKLSFCTGIQCQMPWSSKKKLMTSCWKKKRYTIKYLHSHKNEMIPFIVRNQEASDSNLFYYDLNRSNSFPYVSRSPDCSKLEQINDNYQAIRLHERGRAKQRWILL